MTTQIEQLLEQIQVGVLLNGFVSAIIMGISLAFVIFLFRRWEKLDSILHAYTWFWMFTMLLWMANTFRYTVIGFGYLGPTIHYTDIIIQGIIVFTGPPIFQYAGRRVFGNQNIANSLSLLSFMLGFVSLWFLIQPGGVGEPEITYFSADASINRHSFFIFSGQIAIISALLIYDFFARLQRWKKLRDISLLYDALYSGGLVAYVAVGAIDVSKIILDWPLIVFRLFYTGAFLFIYLILVQQEASHEEYFIEEPLFKSL